MVDWRERVKILLSKKNMTQAQLAETMGVSTAAVSVWLSGKAELTDKNTLKLQYQVAAALNVEPEHLTEGKGETSKVVTRGRAVPHLNKETAMHWVLGGVAPEKTEWVNCPIQCTTKAFCLTVTSASMDDSGVSGVSLPNKSLVFIETELPLELGKVCLFQDKGLVLGTFEEINEQPMIVFNNPRFLPVPVLKDNYIGRSIGCFTQM